MKRLLERWREWKGDRTFRPLHIILWRLLWIGPVILLLAMLCFAMFLGFGIQAAREIWRATT